MYRLFSTLRKELQIVLRERTGLALIFIMPMLLVFVMTLLQHEAYRSLNETGVPVLLVNQDKGELGESIEAAFDSFTLCKLTIDHGQLYSNTDEITAAVLDGKFVVALVIPSGASEKLRTDVGSILDAVMNDEQLLSSELVQVHIDIIVDPIARKSFVLAITSGLREFIASVKTQVLFSMMAAKMQELAGGETPIKFPAEEFFVFNQTYAKHISTDKIYEPNAVQHNVPAWAIFSIFFILIPLAVSIISERSIGLYTRLRTFPGSYLSVLSGKLLLYFLIALTQLIVIMYIGKYGLPYLGLPVLEMGNSYGAFIGHSAAVSLTAVSYGLLLGTIFDTAPHAAIFGSVSILILSAIGGVWVPINIMPEFMQNLAVLSPLSWGLNGYYELFIKGSGWIEIQPFAIRLVLISIGLWLLSYWVYMQKIKYI